MFTQIKQLEQWHIINAQELLATIINNNGIIIAAAAAAAISNYHIKDRQRGCRYGPRIGTMEGSDSVPCLQIKISRSAFKIINTGVLLRPIQ